MMMMMMIVVDNRSWLSFQYGICLWSDSPHPSKTLQAIGVFLLVRWPLLSLTTWIGYGTILCFHIELPKQPSGIDKALSLLINKTPSTASSMRSTKSRTWMYKMEEWGRDRLVDWKGSRYREFPLQSRVFFYSVYSFRHCSHLYLIKYDVIGSWHDSLLMHSACWVFPTRRRDAFRCLEARVFF